MIKVNDIYFNNSRGKDHIIYIMGIGNNTSNAEISFAMVDIETCKSNILKVHEFHNIYDECKLIGNKNVKPMDIMNLTDNYPEYFI